MRKLWSGNDGTYTISNPTYNAPIVMIDDAVFRSSFNQMLSGGNGAVCWRNDTYKHYISQVSASPDQTIIINDRSRSLRAMFCVLRTTNNAISHQSRMALSTRTITQIQDFQVRIGDMLYPNTQINIDCKGVETDPPQLGRNDVAGRGLGADQLGLNVSRAYAEVAKIFGMLHNTSAGGQFVTTTGPIQRLEGLTPYQVRVQQQQLYLQCQLEIQSNDSTGSGPSAAVLVPIQAPPTPMIPIPSPSPSIMSERQEISPPRQPDSAHSSRPATPGLSMKSPSMPIINTQHKTVQLTRSLSQLEDLRVADLRQELKQRSLLVSGTKSQLIERLRNHHHQFQQEMSGKKKIIVKFIAVILLIILKFAMAV